MLVKNEELKKCIPNSKLLSERNDNKSYSLFIVDIIDGYNDTWAKPLLFRLTKYYRSHRGNVELRGGPVFKVYGKDFRYTSKQ